MSTSEKDNHQESRPAIAKWNRLAAALVWVTSNRGWIAAVITGVAYVWIFYAIFVEPFGFRWKARFGEPVYPNIDGIHGIDISHHQGTIDWAKLRNAMIARNPVKFVIVKATEGADFIDEKFEDNFFQALDHGFIRGAYHFWSNSSTAREQAYFFLNHVRLENGDLPPVLDVETKPDQMSEEEFQQEILAWLHIVEDKYHTKPIIYTNYKFKESYLSDARFDDYPYWIAHYYVNEVKYQGKWKFWQHTDVGRLPGIKGLVDLDIYNGSFYDLKKLTISYVPPQVIFGGGSPEQDENGGQGMNDNAVQSP